MRKYDINYIFSLDYIEGMELIKYAIDKEYEDKLWQRWLVDYRKMDSKNFVSFKDYKNDFVQPTYYDDNVEDVLEMAREIEEKTAKKGVK